MRLHLVTTFALLLFAAPAARGLDFFANVALDAADHDLTDGVCDADPVAPNQDDPEDPDDPIIGQCSLRAAVQNANLTPELDFIDLGFATYVLSVSGPDGADPAATGDLDITTPIEIEGIGNDATLIDAKKLKDRIFDVPEGVHFALRRISLMNAKTPKGESGGCVRSGGELILGSVFLFRCAASDDGGCLSVFAGTADVSNSIFSTCKAKGDGGGLELSAAADATLMRSTFGACKAGTGGGIAARGALDLRNVTIDDNGAKLGGGIALLGAEPVTIHSSTISENGKVNVDASQSTGTVTLSNTIVWGAKTDCAGAVTSAGGNLEGAISCAFASTNDQQSQEPQLLPLNFYGGLVPTRKPLSTSPVVDHGIDGATCVSPDARQVVRVDVPGSGVAVCDVGAAEFLPPPP